MIILVTGANGFMGRAVVERLAQDPRVTRVIALARHWDGIAERGRVLQRQATLEHLRELEIAGPIHAVVHLAAAMRSDDFPKLEAVNVQGTAQVLDLCRRTGMGRIIFASSANVYLDNKGAYGATKTMAEALVRDSGMDYTIFRFATVYGPGDGGLDRIAAFIRRYGIVPIFGDGQKIEQPIYIEEAVSFIHQALFSPGGQTTLDAYGATPLKYLEMIRLMAKVMGRRVSLVHIPVPLLRCAIQCLEALHLPCPVTREQVAHIDEDLETDMTPAVRTYGVELQDMEANLRAYLGAAPPRP